MHKRPSSEFFFDDAIRCEESDEGLKFMSFKSDLGARKGVTANSFSLNNDRLVLFGGCLQSSTDVNYCNDVWIFTVGSSMKSPTFKCLDVDGVPPAGRAMHTATTCGPNNKYVAIIGGTNGKEIFDDVWLLDMSLILSDYTYAEAEPVGKGASSKSKAKPYLTWIKLEVKGYSFFGRQLHSCFPLMKDAEGDAKVRLCIFGGVSSGGKLGLELTQLSFDSTISANTNQESQCHVSPLRSSQNSLDGRKLMGAAIAVTGHNGYASSVPDSTAFRVLVFGGGQERTTVLQLSRFTDLSSFFDKDSSSTAFETETKITVAPPRVDYPNGDAYSGDVDTDFRRPGVAIRHGYGEMNYAEDGSTYKVRYT